MVAAVVAAMMLRAVGHRKSGSVLASAPFAIVAFTAWATLPYLARSQSTESLERMAELHPGCFIKNIKYSPVTQGPKTTTVAHCQLLCKAEENCTAFSYWPSTQECAFADDSATRSETVSGAVSGYGVCKGTNTPLSKVCTTEVPHNGFPGLTVHSSNGAWPSGHQPESLECWPLDFAGNYRPCDLLYTLEDTLKGWPGKCMGLFKQEGITGVKQCSQLCSQDPSCPSWQVGLYDWCYHGLGNECFVREKFSPIAAQRFQHGEVRKLMDLAGWQVIGLTRQFVDDQGYFQDQHDAIDACKWMCYSDIGCQFWQYTPSYGCWIEDPWQDFGPGYPLTLDYAYRSTEFALDCIAGEMIMHYCPESHSVSSVHVECEKLSVKYVSPDGAWEDDKVASSAGACQQLCAGTQVCQYFTYFPKGMCRLHDASATEESASAGTVSGPRSCDAQTVKVPVAADAKIEHAHEHEDAPGESLEPILPENPGKVMQYLLKMSFSVDSVDYAELGEGHRTELKPRYALVLAEQLGIHRNEIMECTDGPMDSVALSSQSPAAMLVVACALNHPATSPDLAAYKSALQGDSTVLALEAATRDVIHMGNTALVGLIQVKVLKSVVLSREMPPPPPSGWTRWWPFVLLLVLLCLAVAVVSGAVDFSGSEQSGSMVASERDVDMAYSEDEPVGYNPYAAGNKWQQQPPVGGVAPGGPQGPLRFAQRQMRNLGTAVKSHLPRHRGEFTV